MAHALAAHPAGRHLDATLITNNAFITHPLILPTSTFPVLHRTKDALTEQPIPFGTQGAVVNRLWFGNFPVTPLPNLFWRRKRDANGIKVLYFHRSIVLLVQRPEDRRQRSEGRGQKSEVRNQKSEVCTLSSVFCLLSSVSCLLSPVSCLLSPSLIHSSGSSGLECSG